MRIGELLVQSNLITQDQLDEVLKEHAETHVRIGDLVIQKGYVTQEQLTKFLAEFFQIPFIKLKEVFKNIPAEVIRCVPKDLAYRLKILPVDKKDNSLFVAMSDPLEIEKIDILRTTTGLKIESMIAVESEILNAIEYCYHSTLQMKEQVEDFIDLEVDKLAPAAEAPEADDPPVVAYVKSMIIQAVNNNVSDILLQPKETKADLRFRMDGVLVDQEAPPIEMLNAIVSRIKIMAGLNIAERRVPQDGRFKIKIANNDIDIRVSSMPTIYGESIVLRLLNTSSVLLGLKDLGFENSELTQYKKILENTYGLILVTGPTGSGKTTTLYSSLSEIQSRTKHIITMEDPVEYRLPALTQSQVNTKVGYDFAEGLRAILRQSPDIILVGEIRDRVTAEISIHSALTGHLVFSTLHTNDAASAAIRLVNMGVEPFLITSCLLGVIAQRLIRVICPDCKEEASFDKEMLRKNNLPEDINVLYYGKGCDQCGKIGYKGRAAIYELMIPNEEVRGMILERRSSEDIKKVMVQAGMRTLRHNAIEKMKNGETTLEEVLRLTQETDGGTDGV